MTTLFEIIRHGIWPDTGAELAAKGIARALVNEKLEWREEILEFAEQYAKEVAFFKMEDIHFYWVYTGGIEPHSDKVWGGIARKMVKLGYCEFFEYKKAARQKSHGNIIIVYKSKIYDSNKTQSFFTLPSQI